MSLSYEFGEIYYIKDELIVFPDNFSRPTQNYSRPVLILDNSESKELANPLITIAPITTKTHCKRSYDIELPIESSPLGKTSLIRVGCLQSVCKYDLEKKCKGIIDESYRDQVVDVLIEKFGFSSLLD